MLETQGTCFQAYIYITATATTTTSNNNNNVIIIIINYYLIKRGAYMYLCTVHEQLYPIQYQEPEARDFHLLVSRRLYWPVNSKNDLMQI